MTTTKFQWYWPRTDHQMDFPFTRHYKSPKNAFLTSKPVVDCAAPLNFNDREQNANRYSFGKMLIFMTTLCHWAQSPEIVPYTNTFSSDDCFKELWLYTTAGHVQLYIARVQLGNLFPSNPRTAWAHRINFMAQFFRLQICLVVGGAGYFYGYEWLYTYPPYIRIRDPSPEGWKKSWQEGQTTYIARSLAALFPALGHYIWCNSAKRTPWWFFITAGVGCWYDFCRPAFAGMHISHQFKSNQMGYYHSRYGSLVPDGERRTDPDTNKPFHAANYKYHRMDHGAFHEDCWANLNNNEYQPGGRFGRKVPNPYFNFQKAAQTWNEKPYRTKNDVWEMPTVLNARIMSGSFDS